MRILFTFLISVISASASEIEGENIARKLAEVLAIPFEKSAVEDLREFYAEESGKEQPVLAFRLKLESKNFVPVEYSFGKKGTAMHIEIAEHFKKFANLPPEHKDYGIINKKTIFEGGTVYFGSIWGVQGGFSKIAYIEWPQENLELAISINDPRELSLETDENNEEHLKVIERGIDDSLLDRLTEVFEDTLAEYAPNNTQSESSSGTANEPKNIQTNEASRLRNNAKTESPKEGEEQNIVSYNKWISWFMAGVLLLGISLFFLKTFKGKPAS